jgi:hypothetical protein
MKNIFLILLAIAGFATTTIAQVVNQIIISPVNPTEIDTIRIISDFSYQGNCAFGLVTYNSYLIDSTILIIPLYCGYLDTTQCNSIDTFQVGPFPSSPYTISIEYHQGSVCPYSGFDANIYQLDTSIIITTVSNVSPSLNDKYFPIKIYPNPAKDYITIYSECFMQIDDCQLKITNLLGQQVFQSTINEKQLHIDISSWGKSGVYFIHFIDNEKNIIDIQKIILE